MPTRQPPATQQGPKTPHPTDEKKKSQLSYKSEYAPTALRTTQPFLLGASHQHTKTRPICLALPLAHDKTRPICLALPRNAGAVDFFTKNL